jgi:hypothetical protein
MVPAMRWRALAVVFALAAAGALVISWTQRHDLSMAAVGWTAYVADEPDLSGRLPRYDAFQAMRASDSRLWLGLAIACALAAAATATGLTRRRFAVAVLLFGALAAGGLSWSQRDHLGIGPAGWTSYTPLSNEGTLDTEAITTESGDAVQVTVQRLGLEAYPGMRWNDPRLWLGVAIGLLIAAAATLALRVSGPAPGRRAAA